MKSIKFILLLAFFALSFTSCVKQVEEENDNEVITTLMLNFTPAGGGTGLSYKWEDLDGDGGAAPIIDTIKLAANKTYSVELLMYDKTKNPVVVTSEDIRSEAVNHRFYYEPTAASGIAVSGLDNDENGVPLGLQSVWTTGMVATGNIKVTLRHYPSGRKALIDPVTNPNSSTDAETIFITRVQ